MTYFNRQVIRQYLDNVNLMTREDAVDQLWINILRYYFNDLDCFGIEAQSRPHQDWDYRSNVVVANVRNYIMAKFLFVENKRSSFEDDPRIWDSTRDQLEDYMLGARNDQGNIQIMFGIVGIGNLARFYQLPMNGTALVPYGPARGLNIEHDANTIERILQLLVRDYR
ncbi:hypothetical protein DTO164E3_8249 [Paecilomyces variotii]|nr:hypothetical protein DTO164E3_8249 [Paecilomyces variotii]KAJ9202407.1 hypothetical protein DTO032I3_3660 [Paecilomyces variotii]KAJ9249094.1 hypothetical protein DTO195F2_8624 [Paecilomyces variotii]KAJ9278632.1 hypothetical protein DTO021D3_4541 [Paecilomyces variotii]KAJ9344606.1 hypothetical protein DTO027B6_2788 [Paecilomyces variotii]